MILGLDIDGVLADFNAAYITRIIAITGRDLFPPRPFDIPTWEYPEFYGYKASEIALVWRDIKADPRFWQQLRPYCETHAAIMALMMRHHLGDDVYFITARPGMTAKRQTEQWLLARSPLLNPAVWPTVLMSNHKGLCAQALRLDHYIDDRWENALEVAQTKTKSYLLTRPWNSAYNAAEQGVIRLATLADFFTVIEAREEFHLKAA